MKIVDRYKLSNNDIYSKQKAILDLIYNNDFDKIPIYLRPSDSEINEIFSEIDIRIFNDMDYATIMFAKEVGNDIYPKLSTLSFNLYVHHGINMEKYITSDIAKVIDDIDYQYIKYSIVEIDNKNCIIYLNGTYDHDLLLQYNITLADVLNKMMSVLKNEYENVKISHDIYINNDNYLHLPDGTTIFYSDNDKGFTLYSIIFDYRNNDDYSEKPNDYFPVFVRSEDYDYVGEIDGLIRNKYPNDTSKLRNIYYSVFTPEGGLSQFNHYINGIIPFSGYAEKHLLLTLSEFVKRDYLFEVHGIYEFVLIGDVLYLPRLTTKTMIASDCISSTNKYKHLRAVIKSMKYLLADNVSRELYIKRTGISTEVIDKIFDRIGYYDSEDVKICKSYVEISRIARNPWKAYKRDIKNQFRYNPALFTITIIGLIIACSSIIQVLQQANIIKQLAN